MVVDPTENIFIGGQSFFVNATVGEGFVMLMDKFGKSKFTKTYASTASNGDIVQKVALQGANYIAVGASLTGTSSKFFLLTFDDSGVLGKNLQLGTNTGRVAVTANIAHMYMQGTNAHIIYDTKDVEIVDTSGAVDNFYIDASALTIDNIIKVVVHTANTIYSVFAVTSAKLHIYFVTTATDKDAVVDTTLTVDTSSSLQTGDFDNDATPANVWIAVSKDTTAIIRAHHYAISGSAIPTWVSAVEITAPSNPVAMNIMYVSASSFYISAKLTDLTGSLIKVTGAGTVPVVVADKTMVTGLGGSWFLGEYTGTVIITVGTKTGAESAGFASSQAIAFKSTDALDVTAYNCYDITATDSNTVTYL
jgi:hypothetical protein